MDKIKVAVIGLGGISTTCSLPNLIKINNVTVTAVADINKNRLNTIADKFNIPERYTRYEDLLEKNDSDAIIVATPTATHKEITIAILQAKKDVLVEKASCEELMTKQTNCRSSKARTSGKLWLE